MEHKNRRHTAGPRDEAAKHSKTQSTQAGNGRPANLNAHDETTKRNSEKPTGSMAKDDEDAEEGSSKITGSKAGTGINHSDR